MSCRWNPPDESRSRSVECSITFIYHIRKTNVLKRAPQSVCRHFPVLIASHAVLRARGKLNMIFESKEAVYLVNQLYYSFDLILDLLRHHENMCIILSKASYSHQTVELSGFLMSVVPVRARPCGSEDHGKSAALIRIQGYRPGSSSA